jgi:glycosyltransferase involved in cell wall biosynthesis
MCYDIIPLQFPEFFAEHDVAAFRRYWHAMFPLADRILVTSRRVESDIRNYCAAAGLNVGEIELTPLGLERRRKGTIGTIPENLERGRFALFVSTVEPRKGHAMLLRVWRRLLAAGQPQRHRFKLVFVGRRGWKVEAVLRQIDNPAGFEGTLVHLEHIDDATLDAMYDAAAFCVYPSLYEGFGLPIIEAFSHGKAVLASTGGAVPETVDELSPCLDPADEDAWFAHLGNWIEDPGARAPYEARIRGSFSHPDWDEAAAQFFDRIGDPHPAPARTIVP